MATVPNYLIGGGVTPAANPFQTGLTEGMRFGATMQDFQAAQLQRQQAQQDRELKLQQQQQAMQVQQQQQQAQQAEQQRRVDVQQRLSTKRPQDYNLLDTIALADLYPKDTQIAMKELFAKLPEEKQLQQVKTLGGITSAVRSGNIDAARALMTEQIEANKETDPQESARYKNMLETLNVNPSAVFTTIAPILATFGKPGQDALSSILGAEKTGVETRKLTAEASQAEVQATNEQKVIDANLAEKNWNVKNLKSQISDRVAQRNLDQQRLNLDTNKAIADATAKAGEIPEFAQKAVNEAAINASASKQLASQSMSLAQQLEAAGGGYGALSGASEWLSKTTGTQGALTELRKEYVRLKNQGVIKALPPGVATDKDIELAAAGFLPETANAKTLASFLRGMAKLQTIEANVSNAKVDWLAQNKGLLTKPKSTMVVGDYTAKTGESFSDFSNRIATDTAKQFRSPSQIAEEQRQRSVAQIPTTGGAPAAAKPNVRAAADAILGGAR
jgi:hypothetical protein